MNLIDCKSVREKILDEVRASGYKNLKLVIISTSSDPASKIYVKNKVKTAESVGIEAQVIETENPSYQFVADAIVGAARDRSVTGIILQLPSPKHLRPYERVFLDLIPYEKDVDGLSTESMGRLWSGKPCIVPATAQGVMELLPEDLSGKTVTVVNRSNLIGKPLIKLLLDRDATVNVCHSKTPYLLDEIAIADIVIVGIGVPEYFDYGFFDHGQILIDCGINRNSDGKLCGDVDLFGLDRRNVSVTPVPGGVGILTTAQLMANVVKARELQEDFKYE
jgi:methylenetetrahydrofolate dehydrogenase (NADP+)/methenyltetrahydrofolate cyclohydrolase